MDEYIFPKEYYETGISNSGNYEKFASKSDAIKLAKKLAKEVNEEVWVDYRTEDCPIDSFKVFPNGRIKKL